MKIVFTYLLHLSSLVSTWTALLTDPDPSRNRLRTSTSARSPCSQLVWPCLSVSLNINKHVMTGVWSGKVDFTTIILTC